MARDSDHLAGGFDTENTGGLLTGFLAEEEDFDRHSLWRLGSWGVVSVGAIVVALLANHSSIDVRRDHLAAADLARQAQQIQSAAKESQNEARRLADAIDTLNGDRDRLYSRVTVLEQGLDSVTGAIARQSAAASPSPPAPTAASAANEPQSATQNPPPAPLVSAVATTAAPATEKPRAEATGPEKALVSVASVAPEAANSPAVTPATPLVASKSMMAPPDAAATKLIEPDRPAKAITAAPMPKVVASSSSTDDPEPDITQAVPPQVLRTEFGVDVGGANSVGGLRALWRGLLKSHSNAVLTTLRPIIVVRERSNGLGMQLRLVAGPLADAAAAAKICAGLIENERPCETAVFDGQRLAMKSDEPPGTAAATPVKPVATRPAWRRRSAPRRVANEEPAKKSDPPSTLSALFGRR